MIVFFIILAILFFISVLILILCLSSLELEINELFFNSNNKKDKKLEKYLFLIRIKLFKNITWFKVKIDKSKMQAIENSKILKCKIFNNINKYKNIKDIILKNKDEILKKDNINYIKELNIKLKELDLNMKLSTSNNIFTSFSIAILATLISIIVANNVTKYNKQKFNYIIAPKYEDKLSLKVNLNCIINIKIVHIMNVIYMLIKKRSVEYDGKSNRRTYASFND